MSAKIKDIQITLLDISEYRVVQIVVPGHGSVLQSAVSVESPEQSAPPLLGDGFVQVLVLDLVPVPHVLVNSP